ncbi:SAM-dependent methyltransferase [Sutterella massiliensis]|uniref:SAM-dependent methyltransferase n=1 Tax=Sutterella massiliensis TaxID=1816689 RepID=A0ABS2DT53_9BURK|nr:SAM-dependent methyltransferase [Sutterella massiliensis]MBM6704526.1 SAM-dependent methyltransferase [Sutterella massiliensis]
MPGTIYLLPNLVSDGKVADALPAGTLDAMRRIDRFLVEAAKTARAAIKAMGHPKPVSELVIEEIGHDPDPGKIDGWLAPVLAGEDAAILSESGCPGVADPGAQIVARAHALGIRVRPLVGPSSILLALMASGLDGQRFRFLGYLPIAEDERRAAIVNLERQSRASETQLFIETPYRNTHMLASLVKTLAPETRVTVATDIMGAGESIRTLHVREWKELDQAARTLPKLPTVFAVLAEAGRGSAPRYAPEHAKHKGEKTEKAEKFVSSRPNGTKPHRGSSNRPKGAKRPDRRKGEH